MLPALSLKKSRQYLYTKALRRFEATKGFSLVNYRHGTNCKWRGLAVSLCSEETTQTDTTSNAHFLFFQLCSKGCVQLQMHSYLCCFEMQKKINTFSSFPDSTHLSQAIIWLPASFSVTFLFLYPPLLLIFFISFSYLGSLLLLSSLVSRMTFLFFSL